MNRVNCVSRIVWVVSLATIAGIVVAQYQVNTQVNNQIYGGGPSGSVRYGGTYSSNQLPSEARYSAWRSGALPSELRMNYRAVGPLAPSGTRAYIPPPTPPTQRYTPTPGYSLGSVRNVPQSYISPVPINPYLTRGPR